MGGPQVALAKTFGREPASAHQLLSLCPGAWVLHSSHPPNSHFVYPFIYTHNSHCWTSLPVFSLTFSFTLTHISKYISSTQALVSLRLPRSTYPDRSSTKEILLSVTAPIFIESTGQSAGSTFPAHDRPPILPICFANQWTLGSTESDAKKLNFAGMPARRVCVLES